MESKKHKTDNVHKKNTLVLPKSYIGQEPVKIKHKRYNSLTDDILNKELSNQSPDLIPIENQNESHLIKESK